MSITQRWLLLAVIILLVAVIYLLQPILMPFLVAAALAYLGDPLVDRMEALRLNRTVAVCIVFLLMSIVITIAVLLMVPMLGRQLDNLITRLPAFVTWLLETVLPYLQRQFDLPQESLPTTDLKALVTDNWQQAGNVLAMALQQVGKRSLTVVAVMTNLFLIPVVTFYLLRDWDLIIARIRESLPRSWEPLVVKLSLDCDEVLSAFLRGQLVVMLCLGLVYSIGLTLIGLELALLLGTLAGLASIVPYMGFVVGILASVIAAYLQYHEWMPLLYVAIVFGAGQMLEGTILTPLLVGDKIGLHPVAVIFAILAGGQLAGFVGILLALPVAAVIMVLFRHAHSHYKNSEFYSAQELTNPVDSKHSSR